MTKLCPRGKAAAKRKFKVYPSAYANAYASKICAGKIKDPSGVKRKDFKGPKPAAEGALIISRPGREQILQRRKERLRNPNLFPKGGRKIIKGGDRKGRPISKKPNRFGERSKLLREPKPMNKGGGANTNKKIKKKNDPNKGVTYDRPRGMIGRKPLMISLNKGGSAYTGSYIKSEIDGKKISNKSYEKYYKGMI